MKPKELATPKGIDHDYNYLTSIERQLDLAEKDATSRGVVTEDGAQPKGHTYVKGEKALENALEKCGVVVSRAPRGMSRSKMNATKWKKKWVDSLSMRLLLTFIRTKILEWTVEWAQPNGTKTIGICPENQPLSEAYAAHLRWLNPDRLIKKRKTNDDVAQQSPTRSQISQTPGERLHPDDSQDLAATTISTSDEADSSHFPVEDSHSIDNLTDDISSPAGAHTLTQSQKRKRRRRFQIERATSRQKAQCELDSETQLQRWKEAIDSKQKAETELQNSTEDAKENANHSCSNAASCCKTTRNKTRCKECEEVQDLKRRRLSNGDKPAPKAGCPNSEMNGPSGHNLKDHTSTVPKSSSDVEVAFYLHHPSLPSRHPVLIPLSPTAILATALTNRLVLEFPTIYVLQPQSDGKLPEGYISEDEFFRKAKKELVHELEEGEVGDDDREESREDRRRLEGNPEVDERRLTEVLGKDLNGTAKTML